MNPVQEYEINSKLKDALNRALAQIEKQKRSKEELVAAVYQAAKDGISALKIKNVPTPPQDKRKGSEEVAVPVLGDWQLGKRTPDYNSQVCEERIEKYGEKVIKLTQIQRADHPVRECRVWLLGDVIEGITIFPGQAYLVDSSLYRQITLDGPRILANFLRKMLANFDKVHVTAVIGNHGRFGRRGEYDPESNGDRMLYRITQQLLANEDRLTWTIPDGMGERHWYAIDRIGEYSSLLCHGDQFGGRLQGTITIVGAKSKINGWRSGGVSDSFKDITFGHWHSLLEIPLNNGCMARCNGSPESTNTYAQEYLASMSQPSQRLMFVSPKLGIVSAEYKVWL